MGSNRAGEVRLGRFLRNDRVTPDAMIAAAAARTAGLVAGRHILVIQDTTTLRDDGDQCSLNLHPAIAVDAANGALLGLVDAVFLHREGGQRGQTAKRAFEEKESRRWLDVTIAASQLAQAGAASVTVIADREGDMYDVFALRPASTELLVRAHYDRVLASDGRLFAATEQLPELGRDTVSLPSAPGRPARLATMVLKVCQVTLNRPKRNRAEEKNKLPPEVVLTLVEAQEIDAPSGVTPAHWRLLTTHSVTTLADARQITRYYRERWTIEQLFRTMKTKGFNIEAVRVADHGPYENLVTATLIAAIRVLQMVRDRDGTAHRSLDDAFDPADQPALEAVCTTLEGNTARQKNPHAKGSLAYAAWICARLGGWNGYYGKPGPVVILQGFLRFKAMQQGWLIPRDV